VPLHFASPCTHARLRSFNPLQDYLRTLPLTHVVYIHTAFFYENICTKRGTKRVKVGALFLAACGGRDFGFN
jgi:hypothetical protein